MPDLVFCGLLYVDMIPAELSSLLKLLLVCRGRMPLSSRQEGNVLAPGREAVAQPRRPRQRARTLAHGWGRRGRALAAAREGSVQHSTMRPVPHIRSLITSWSCLTRPEGQRPAFGVPWTAG
jgi:hypothetical protein